MHESLFVNSIVVLNGVCFDLDAVFCGYNKAKNANKAVRNNASVSFIVNKCLSSAVIKEEGCSCFCDNDTRDCYFVILGGNIFDECFFERGSSDRHKEGVGRIYFKVCGRGI